MTPSEVPLLILFEREASVLTLAGFHRRLMELTDSNERSLFAMAYTDMGNPVNPPPPGDPAYDLVYELFENIKTIDAVSITHPLLHGVLFQDELSEDCLNAYLGTHSVIPELTYIIREYVKAAAYKKTDLV